MDVHEIYLEIEPEEIAYVKFIFESYEGVGIIRTALRQARRGGTSSGGEAVEPQPPSGQGLTAERKKAVIVVLVVDDFLEVAHAVLASLEKEISLVEIPRPEDAGDDWLMRELAAAKEEG